MSEYFYSISLSICLFAGVPSLSLSLFFLVPFNTFIHSLTRAHGILFSCENLQRSDKNEYCAMHAHFIHICRPPQTLPYPYNREQESEEGEKKPLREGNY